MDEQRFDAFAKMLAAGRSRRSIAKMLLGGTIAGAMASIPHRLGGRFPQPPTAFAAAQVVTPEPTMPSFANTRGVLPIDYVSNPDPNVIGLASGHVENSNTFPAATVRVQNDRAFWLAISVVHEDVGVAITKNESEYAQYGLIAPHKSADYAARFAPDTTSELDFGVDGSASWPVFLTLVQLVVEGGLLAANVSKEDFGKTLIEVVTAEKVAQLDQATTCVEAVRTRATDKLQQCFASPLLQETAQEVLAKVLSPKDFSDLKDLVLTLCPDLSGNPAWIASCKLLAWGDFALNANDVYAAWTSGPLSGSVKFLGFVAGQPQVTLPGGFWVAPEDGATVTEPSLQLTARAYPSHDGDPAIARVQFTGWWPAVGPKEGPWKPLCAATKQVAVDVYQCEVDLSQIGAPSGSLTISFDVFDQHNNANYAPNGEHVITWAPALSPSATSAAQPAGSPAVSEVDPQALLRALSLSPLTAEDVPSGYNPADFEKVDTVALIGYAAFAPGGALGSVVFMTTDDMTYIVYEVFADSSGAQAGLQATSQTAGRMGFMSIAPPTGFSDAVSAGFTGFVLQRFVVGEYVVQQDNVLVFGISLLSANQGVAIRNAQDLVTSGVAHLNRVLATAITNQSTPPPSSQGAMFTSGETVVVTVNALEVRSSPGYSGNSSVGSPLAEGTRATIVSGPVNADDDEWYQVRLDDGTTGWVVGRYLAASR